ncbi:unnamed protein product [Cuscuta epithymum]|uniref:Secreted protein n=1 Tax=Cuscuta epithymum TaxID=186058 RepID=A0AAV0C155_9ASTE|nr:unnamed protein product [Cuscuta epithymum]
MAFPFSFSFLSSSAIVRLTFPFFFLVRRQLPFFRAHPGQATNKEQLRRNRTEMNTMCAVFTIGGYCPSDSTSMSPEISSHPESAREKKKRTEETKEGFRSSSADVVLHCLPLKVSV